MHVVAALIRAVAGVEQLVEVADNVDNEAQRELAMNAPAPAVLQVQAAVQPMTVAPAAPVMTTASATSS